MVQPIGPLMIEHRLIERMIAVMKAKTERMKSEGTVDQDFIETAVDFIRTYADRCHHGKEEEILFRDLRNKDLSKEDKHAMDELIQDHIWGRQTTSELVKNMRQYANGNKEVLGSILDSMAQLAEFYPKHIEKEDKYFFRAAMNYLTKEEQNAMLEEEYEFDRNFIHQVYQDIVRQAEKSSMYT